MRGLLLCSLSASFCVGLHAQVLPTVQNASGLRLVVADENSYPTLRVILPGHPVSDRAIEVIFPEHVTVRRVGETEGKHLFLFQPGQHGDRPAWRQVGRSLQYEMDFVGGLHMIARATLEDDGVRFRYEFDNRSKVEGSRPSFTMFALSGRMFTIRMDLISWPRRRRVGRRCRWTNGCPRGI